MKKSHEGVAERLSIYDITDDICFWYVSETTQKGEQLRKILNPQDVFNLHQDNPSEFIEKIESIWRSIEKPLPFWLSKVTIGLFGSNGNDKLKSERESLIQKRNEEREIQRIEQERLRKIEKEKLKIEQEKRTEERKRSMRRCQQVLVDVICCRMPFRERFRALL